MKQVYNKKLKQVRMSMVKSAGGISGGTLASALNLFASPWSVLKELQNPFILSNHKGLTKFNGSLARYNPLQKCYESKFVMENANVPVVLKSSELGYGEEFEYFEGQACDSYLKATIGSLVLNFVTVALLFPPMRWLMFKLLPQVSK